MSPLWKKTKARVSATKQIQNNSPTLQYDASGCGRMGQLQSDREGTLLSASRFQEGSMTVEAAVIIPLLLFLVLNLTSVIEMLRLHSGLELALWKYGKVMAVGSHMLATEEADENPETAATLLTDAAVYLAVVNELGGEYLEQSPLTYGKAGLSFLRSSYMEEDCIDIHLAYRVSPEFTLPGFRSFWMVNRYYARAWTGYCVSGDTAVIEYVYVTAYGTVYHESLQCSHLKRTIEMVSIDDARTRCNELGEQYRLCELCGLEGRTEAVYITPDGECYHARVNCAALKRTLQVLEKEEAGEKYKPCSRCAVQNE